MRVDNGYGHWAAHSEDGTTWSSPVFHPADPSTEWLPANKWPGRGWSAVSVAKALKGNKSALADAVRSGLAQIKDQIARAKADAGLGGKVYQYGISAVYDEELVVSQMLAGHRYQSW